MFIVKTRSCGNRVQIRTFLLKIQKESCNSITQKIAVDKHRSEKFMYIPRCLTSAIYGS